MPTRAATITTTVPAGSVGRRHHRGGHRHYPWPDPDDPGITRGLKAQVEHWRSTTDCALVLNLHSPFIHQTQYLRGLRGLVHGPRRATARIAEALFDACMEVRMGYARNILKAVGRDVGHRRDAPTTWAPSRRCSSRRGTYRKLIKPRQKKYFDVIHSMTDAPLLLHSCGSVYAVLNDLVEIGVQILNPVQTHAANMDPAETEAAFRRPARLLGRGGHPARAAIRIGRTMCGPTSPHLAETLGAGGGWVLCPSHDIQPEVPPQNILAMYRGGAEITRLGLSPAIAVPVSVADLRGRPGTNRLAGAISPDEVAHKGLCYVKYGHYSPAIRITILPKPASDAM